MGRNSKSKSERKRSDSSMSGISTVMGSVMSPLPERERKRPRRVDEMKEMSTSSSEASVSVSASGEASKTSDLSAQLFEGSMSVTVEPTAEQWRQRPRPQQRRHRQHTQHTETREVLRAECEEETLSLMVQPTHSMQSVHIPTQRHSLTSRFSNLYPPPLMEDESDVHCAQSMSQSQSQCESELESERMSASESEDGDSSVDTLRIHESVEETQFGDDFDGEDGDGDEEEVVIEEEEWDAEDAIILHHANKLLELIPDEKEHGQ